MIRISALCLIGATILMWGCADNPLMDSPARDVEITVPAVAEALARAAEAEEVRADLVRVFRNSEYVEHKLELDELLRRAPLVRDAIAGRLGVRTDHLERFAAGNAHDVYLPFAQDRATWDGEAVPVVAHAEDVDGVGAMLYSALEAARWVRLGDLRYHGPLIVIHPAEPKSRRVANWARESTRAIQERDEPQIGGVLTYVNEAGHRMEVQLADVSAREVLPFLAICHENCWDYEGGGDGGSNPQPTWNVRLKQIEAYYGDGVGSAEVEWRFSKGGTTTTVRIEGLDHGSSTWSHDVQIRNTIIWASHNEPTGTISVSAKETDAGSDDPWGNGTVGVGWSAGQPVTHTGSTTQFCTEIGDPDTSGCHHTLDYGNSTPTSAFQVRAEYIPPPQ